MPQAASNLIQAVDDKEQVHELLWLIHQWHRATPTSSTVSEFRAQRAHITRKGLDCYTDCLTQSVTTPRPGLVGPEVRC